VIKVVGTDFSTRSKVLIMVFLALKTFDLVFKVVGTDFVITLGQRESDNIIQMITISESPSRMKYCTDRDLGLGKSGSI
jgi:hypothetical protein